MTTTKPRKPRKFTVVGYHDDRDLEHFVTEVIAADLGAAWRAALAAEARDKRRHGESNARIRRFLEYATEVVTLTGWPPRGGL